MVFLLLAILSSALVSIVMRLSTDRAQYKLGMLVANYATCLVLSLLYTGMEGILPATPSLLQTFLLGGTNGVLFLASFVIFQYNVQKNGVVLSSVFMKLGLLVPLVLSVFCFSETPTCMQGIGFALAIAAILLINAGPTAGKRGGGVYLVLLLLLGGSADAMSKVFEEVGDSVLGDSFLLYTFAVALLLCIGCLLYKRQRIGKNELFYGVLIGLPNFFSTKFLLAALGDIAAVIVYPTYSVATILTVSLAGVFLFRERLRARQWAAVGVILISLVLLNL